MIRWTRMRWAAAGALALLILAAGAMAARTTPAGAAEGDDARTLSISGEARAQLKPDTAEIRLGVRTEAQTARDAMKRNADAVAAVVAALKQAGVKEEELGTENWNVQPIFRNRGPEGPAPEVAGYVAQLTVSVRTGKVDAVGDLIDRAFAAGANVAEGVRFVARNTAQVEDRLLEDAVKAARAKAEVLAKASGVRIVGVKRLTAGGPVVIQARNFELAAGQASAAPMFVPPGQSEISRSVHIEYLIGD